MQASWGFGGGVVNCVGRKVVVARGVDGSGLSPAVGTGWRRGVGDAFEGGDVGCGVGSAQVFGVREVDDWGGGVDAAHWDWPCRLGVG